MSRGCGQREQETKLPLCLCFVPTCMLVVGRGLWALSAAALLEEEGGSFDHKEALTEAEKKREVQISSGLTNIINSCFIYSTT